MVLRLSYLKDGGGCGMIEGGGPIFGNFCCRYGYFPILYLGLPIEANPRLNILWDLIIEKFENKLSKRKRQHLSLGERITLIKATLSNLPVYCVFVQGAKECA